MSKPQAASRSIIKGTAPRIPTARDIPFNEPPKFVTGLSKPQAFRISRFLHENEIVWLGPQGHRERGKPGGWAWKLRIDEPWVAEVAFVHALSVDEEIDMFEARIRRLLWQRAAVETAYALRGLNAIIPMLGDLRWDKPRPGEDLDV